MARDASTELPLTPWAQDADTVLAALSSHREGLASAEAQRRLQVTGRNEIGRSSRSGAFATLAAQFKSPLLLILVFAAVISAINRDWIDSLIVMTIIAASASLTFTQEYTASRAVEKLLARVSLRARLLRDGAVLELDARDIVPGDIALLSAGSLVPADWVEIHRPSWLVPLKLLQKKPGPPKNARDPGFDTSTATATRAGPVCGRQPRPGHG